MGVCKSTKNEETLISLINCYNPTFTPKYTLLGNIGP